MISFKLTEEQSIAQASIREFAAAVLAPNAQKNDDQTSLSSSVLEQLWELGIVQARTDADIPDAGIMGSLLLEELARGDASAAIAVAAPLGFAAAIVDQGSADQKQRFLPALAGDSYHGAAVLLLESAVSFGAGKVSTEAKETSDGYLLTGVKSFVPLAEQCRQFLVVARLDDRLEAFIVDAQAPGVERQNFHATLGLRGIRAGTVRFNNVFVDRRDRLGESAGADVSLLIDASRTALASILAGVSASVLDYVVPYTKDRVAHGEALAKKQTIAFRIADMHMKVEAMRWMHWRAARALDRRTETSRLCRLAQVYANTHAMWVADEGLQMLGGHGFTREYPVEMWYRNVRALSMLDGAIGV